MRTIAVLFFLTLFSLTSCRKDFDTVPSKGTLEFSKTTVYLDTVFTGVASSTYTLKVYNRSNEDISIPTIGLGKGNSSKYRLLVDGMMGEDGPDADHLGDGKLFKNVELLAHDSLYVFIEETSDIADANPSDMLYTDEIQFSSTNGIQKVNLVTLIQDAIFLFPDRTANTGGGYTYENLQLDDTDPNSKIYGFKLTGSELHFTNAKPYVIYGYAGVASGDVLTIDPGARVHFHDQSGIFVKNGGSIHVNGAPSPAATPLLNEVVFEGDRLEPDFAEVPGQWGIIYLADGSTNNSFNHATIKNATVGIFVDRQDATTTQIKNTQIYNASNYGIVGRKAKIYGENIAINKCGQSSLACILGGTYDFLHCSFANFWSSGSRQTPAVYLDNTYLQDNTLFVSDLNATFNSCLMYGSNNIEVGVKQSTVAQCNVDVQYSLIKFQDSGNQFGSNPLYGFVTNPSPKNNIVATNSTPNNPNFKNTTKNDLRITTGSAAIAKGKPLATPPNDLNNVPRPVSPQRPDIGAYEHIN